MDKYNIVLTIVIAVVVLTALAIWLGRKIKISKSNDGFTVETEAELKNKKNDITVGDGLEIKTAKVGNIIGHQGEKLDLKNSSEQNIKVMNNGKIENSETGDIIGFTNDKNGEKK